MAGLAGPFTVRSTDNAGIDGDSRSTDTTAGDVTTVSRWWVGLKEASDAFFAPANATTPRKPVPWINFATDGATVQAKSATIAANVALYKIKKLVVFLDVNDVRAGRTTLQIKTDWASYCNNAIGAGVTQILALTGGWSGELWSAGDAGNPNAFDAAFKALLVPAELPATLAAIVGVTYFDTRALFFNKYEPIYNTPEPGVSTRILTQDPAGATGGLHPNPRGSALLVTAVLPFVQFAT